MHVDMSDVFIMLSYCYNIVIMLLSYCFNVVTTKYYLVKQRSQISL